jgi:hypothetical protein
MLPSRANFTQPQVSIVRDFGHGKPWTIETTGNDASGAAAAFSQDEIAELVALPTGHLRHDDICDQIFTTGRSVVENPPVQRTGNIVRPAILGLKMKREGQQQ